VKGIYDELAELGDIFHWVSEGLTVTMDTEAMVDGDRAAARAALEAAISELGD
jgi:hypothetical protein